MIKLSNRVKLYTVNMVVQYRVLNVFKGDIKKDGSPVSRPEGAPGRILFGKIDDRRGAPQQTWLELSRTSFWGSGRYGLRQPGYQAKIRC